ncbi:MAG: Na-translocating system protein MpsC family protein [Bacillota bacterium]|nr:Na-translocating system protein MpsC family protein [Bacillota bacterium]
MSNNRGQSGQARGSGCHKVPELGELKQEIARIYNQVNQEAFEIGVRRLRVDIVGTKIVVLADHKRIRGLDYLDRVNRAASRMADVALLDAFKERMREELERQLPWLGVRSILKDYDPEAEIAGTIIVMDKPLTGE